MLQFMGSQRIGHDWATEQQQKLFFILIQDHSIFLKNIVILITENGEKKSNNKCIEYIKVYNQVWSLRGRKKAIFRKCSWLVYSQVIFVS